MIATNLEQSKRLLELGLDPATADMSWDLIWIEDRQINDYRLDLIPYKANSRICIPAWSLSALRGVMPTYVNDSKWRLCYEDAPSGKHRLSYVDVIWNTFESVVVENEDLITAAYEMVCWLLEQGFIKKGGTNGTSRR